MTTTAHDAAPPKESPAPTGSSYDALPYSIQAFPQCTPDRLSVVAALFGLNPAHPDRCRTLELGCAAGGNLIPLASVHPHSQFIGIDLSSRQIEDGLAMVRELGLQNISLQHKSITDITPADGQFDYVLVHGVYSWVPPEVQAKILQICRENLAPNGVAYVSYNTYPGWHARAAIREMLWFHTEHLTDPQEKIRQARALLAFLAKSSALEHSSYSSLMREELALLMRTPDAYLLHEHLEEFNEPLYFHQFATRAQEAGLQYLGEAQISAMIPARLGKETEQTLRALSPDLLHLEQYMDFVRNRMFRQSLLVHGNVQIPYKLHPAAVESFYISSRAKAPAPATDPAAAETFTAANSRTLTTTDPVLKSAMHVLVERSPLPIAFESLLTESLARLGRSATPEDAPGLASRLLNAHINGGNQLLDLAFAPPAFTITLSEKPTAAPYVRLRAKAGLKVSNQRLESIGLTDPARHLLIHLDGTRDRTALIAIMIAYLENHPARKDVPVESPQERSAKYLDQILPIFAQSALLIA